QYLKHQHAHTSCISRPHGTDTNHINTSRISHRHGANSAVSTPAISPTVTVPTPAISPTITLPTPSVSSTPIPSVSPTVTLPTPSASPSPTPAPSPTFTVPKQLDVELPQPLTETPAVSTPAISPTLAVPIPAVSPTLTAPTQPELDIELTPPLTEPVLPIIDAPPVQQIESLAFGRSKRERKESTRNQVANSIGSLNIGKDNSTSKKRSKPLTHGVPANMRSVVNYDFTVHAGRPFNNSRFCFFSKEVIEGIVRHRDARGSRTKGSSEILILIHDWLYRLKYRNSLIQIISTSCMLY
ncbi:hypothetical protein EDD22DRAFT_997379, partial [Suillus occidentalis]